MPGSVPPLRTVSGTVVLLQSRTMLMSVTRVITKDHVRFCGLYCMQPEVMLKSQGLAELVLSLTGYHMVAPAVRQCENWLRPLPVQRGRIGKDVGDFPHGMSVREESWSCPSRNVHEGKLALPLSGLVGELPWWSGHGRANPDGMGVGELASVAWVQEIWWAH